MTLDFYNYCSNCNNYWDQYKYYVCPYCNEDVEKPSKPITIEYLKRYKKEEEELIKEYENKIIECRNEIKSIENKIKRMKNE